MCIASGHYTFCVVTSINPCKFKIFFPDSFEYMCTAFSMYFFLYWILRVQCMFICDFFTLFVWIKQSSAVFVCSIKTKCINGCKGNIYKIFYYNFRTKWSRPITKNTAIPFSLTLKYIYVNFIMSLVTLE